MYTRMLEEDWPQLNPNSSTTENNCIPHTQVGRKRLYELRTMVTITPNWTQRPLLYSNTCTNCELWFQLNQKVNTIWENTVNIYKAYTDNRCDYKNINRHTNWQPSSLIHKQKFIALLNQKHARTGSTRTTALLITVATTKAKIYLRSEIYDITKLIALVKLENALNI